MASHPDVSAPIAASRRSGGGSLPVDLGAVLFDWDGTLVDSRAALLRAWRESTASVTGASFPVTDAEEREVLTHPGSVIWPRLVSGAEQLQALADSFQAAYEGAAHLVRAVPGAHELLSGLHDRGIAVGVVTSKARRRFGADAQRAGLGELIDAATCAGDAERAKPDPQPVLMALERLGTDPASALMVGDTEVDIIAGQRAGTAVAGVSWGACTARELLDAGAGFVLDAPGELTGMLPARAARTAGPADAERGSR